eukprot:1138526-Alexandrium_andersonii.AAC.1
MAAGGGSPMFAGSKAAETTVRLIGRSPTILHQQWCKACVALFQPASNCLRPFDVVFNTVKQCSALFGSIRHFPAKPESAEQLSNKTTQHRQKVHLSKYLQLLTA